MIADGTVLIIGTGETGDTWRLAAARAETVTTPRGGLDTTLTGGTELTFAGTLRGGGTERGRVEIRSAGPARMHSDALPQPGRTQSRGSIVFEQDVIVDQWAETGELETHIEAPELTIGGFWSNDPGGDGRLDPETLTASGTADKRVLIERGAGLDLVAHCQVLTWRVHRDTQLERLLLGGRPSVRFTDTSGMVPTGQGEAGVAATVFVDAKESIEFQWRHGLAADSSAADDPTRPFATVAASGDVLLRRAVDERESYRISARAIDVAFDADQEVRGIHAYDNVEMAGTGDTPGAPRVVLRGDRLSAERDPDLGTDERVRSTVFVFGDASRPAEARVEETHGPQGVLRPKPIEHVLRGEQLRYEEGGTRLIARRSARAEIDADRQEHSDRSAPPLPGNLTVRAGEIVAHLDPAAAELTRGGDLRKLVATGGVSITAGDTYVVTGDTIEYDHVAAQAIARGRPARSVRKGVAGRDDFVNSDEIHVAFARQANGKPEPQRVTCDGGMIQIFQPVKDDEPPRRLVITADGPIEMLSSSGSATGDVRMTVNEISPSGAAQQRAALTAERVDLTFDPTARNRPASERLQRAVAVGSTGRPVRLVTTDRTATADRAELTGPWIDLTSPFGNPVHVIEHGPPRSEMVCDSARYNLRTNDFNMIRARVATEGR